VITCIRSAMLWASLPALFLISFVILTPPRCFALA
jgi:hypothetical protein